MSKRIIHVNRANIAHNLKHGTNRPVFTIKEGRKTTYARGVEILGPSRMVYGGPLPCGARAWIETEATLVYTDPMTFAEAQGE